MGSTGESEDSCASVGEIIPNGSSSESKKIDTRRILLFLESNFEYLTESPLSADSLQPSREYQAIGSRCFIGFCLGTLCLGYDSFIPSD
jgi:hypothetical protein